MTQELKTALLEGLDITRSILPLNSGFNSIITPDSSMAATYFDNSILDQDKS